MKIKNYQLDTLFKAVNYDMPFKIGRVRNDFVEEIKKAYTKFEKNKMDIINKFSEKDKEGNPVTEKVEGDLTVYRIIKGKEETVQKEIEVLNSEETEIPMDNQIISIIENSKVDLNINDVSILDEVLKDKKDIKKNYEVRKER